MYLGDTFNRNQMYGPYFVTHKDMYKLDDEVIEQAEVCEVWLSSFNDEGPDFTEFRFIKDGEVFNTKRVGGY
jgi:hypothetical protein